MKNQSILIRVSRFLGWFLAITTCSWAGPSANDLIAACQKNIQTDFQTQHTAYSLTTILTKQNQTPVTNIQTIEMYKKKPDLLKMITDNGFTQQEMVAQGGYMYIKVPNTGKYTPVKSAFPINPFLQITNTLSNFKSSSVTQNGNFYEITIKGGQLPDTVDHAVLRIDPATNTMTYVEGWDKKGNKVMTMDITYQMIGKYLQIKGLNTQTVTGSLNVSIVTKVFTNEINQNIDSTVFAVK